MTSQPVRKTTSRRALPRWFTELLHMIGYVLLAVGGIDLYHSLRSFGHGTDDHVARGVIRAFVGVDLAAPARWLDRSHGLRRHTMAANRHLVGTPWCILATTLGWDAPTLAAELEARRRHYLGLS